MRVNNLKLNDRGYPECLKFISSPPKQLFYRGQNPDAWLAKPRLAVVGSRKVSAYGREVTSTLVREASRADIVIISGLALGIDSIAHEACLAENGITVAVLPGPVDKIYPSSHLNLANRILNLGGTLMSEYAKDAQIFKQNFVVRSRIISGLADALLVTEAAIRGGSLHTAKFALEQGKTVLAVPGNITSENSAGTNNLIKSGAIPVTDITDILLAMGINPEQTKTQRTFRGSTEEEKILKMIRSGIGSQETLVSKSGLSAAEINTILTLLEIGGFIKPMGGGNWLAA